MTTTVRLRTILMCAAALMLGSELRAQTQYEAVHTFSGNKGGPIGALTEGADARVYGTTMAGGFFGKGSVYVTDGAGTVTTIHDFDGTDGEAPRGQLLLASDGALYGTASRGGAGFGTIFRITNDGSFETVASFDLTGGAFPQAGLVEVDGHLYGTTLAGGSTGNGTLFRLTIAGQLTTLVSFDGTNGSFPSGALIQSTDGLLYGSTRGGGAFGHGTIFRVNISDAAAPTVQTVHSFSGADGSIPTDGPMQASDGHFYGTTSKGGDPSCNRGCGTLYRLSLDGAEPVISTLVTFAGFDGELPTGALRELSDGLYGTTELGGTDNAGTIYRLSLDGTFNSLASLTFDTGAFPASGVIQAGSGAIYGTSETAGPGGYGTVFELMPDGAVRLAAAFTGTVGADPSSRLTQGSDDSFYGTTVSGGEYGLGTIFRLTAEGDVATVASFTPETGSFPSGALLQASDGDFYGTTEAGGSDGAGTIFRLTTTGSLTLWASISAADHGSTPLGGLTEGSDGSLYGTLMFGPGDSPGAVFRVNKANGNVDAQGVIETVATFPSDETRGASPTSGLTEAPDGSFYGTAEMGGEFGAGTVFRVAGSDLSAVVSFSDGDGSYPASRLLLGTDGNLYGTTTMGGATGDGTLFQLTLDGSYTLTSLASFDFANGSFPYQQGVVQVGDSFYGTTMLGGDADLGTVYRWSADTGLTVLHSMDGVTGDRPNTGLIEARDGALYGTAIGPQGGVIFRMAADPEVEAILDVTPASATYGGSTTLSATLTGAGAPIDGAEVTFSLNGTPVGSATTGADGVAALPNVSVTGIDAGSYPGAVEASFAGGTGVQPATAQGDLTIGRATAAIEVADATYVYDAQPHPASGTATGVAGEALEALTFTYNGDAAAPVEPGTYAVLASYAGSLNYEPASATASITIAPAPAGAGGLIAAYAFDEGTGGIAGDASGKGHFGTIKQARWVNGGRFGGALDFDGFNDWVTIDDAADLDSRDGLTLEAWVKPRTLLGWSTILLKESRNGLAYSLYANDFYPVHPAGYVNVGGADVSVVDNVGLALNAWSHVAMTYDGTMLRLYINGAEVGTRALTGRIIATDGDLRIGGNSVWGEFFDGLIDEVRIYARALPQSEIVRDMTLPIAREGVAPSVSIVSPANGATLSGIPVVSVSASDNLAISSVQLQVNGVDVAAQAVAPATFTLDFATGTYVLTAVARDVAGNTTVSAPITVTIANAAVADYRFNEGSGSTVIDASGYNNHGSTSGGVSRITDATRGQVLSFNGSSGLVSVADADSLDLTTGMTLEAWVRPTSVDGWRTVVLKEGDGLSYALYANDPTNSRPAAYVRIDDDDESIRGRKRLTANVWTHLAMTYDGTMMRLFVNGDEVESRRQTGAVDVSSGKLRIGGNQVWGEWFRGQIDDVRIYGVAVGAAQIKADMKR